MTPPPVCLSVIRTALPLESEMGVCMRHVADGVTSVYSSRMGTIAMSAPSLCRDRPDTQVEKVGRQVLDGPALEHEAVMDDVVRLGVEGSVVLGESLQGVQRGSGGGDGEEQVCADVEA